MEQEVQNITGQDVQQKMPLGAAERYPGLYTMIEVMAQFLDQLVFNGSQMPSTKNAQTCKFYSDQPCPYPIHSYLKRIAQYSGCSNEVFVLLMVYIDRLVQGQIMNLTPHNVHRVIITCAMIGAKFFDDQFYFNPFFAQVGGIKAPEINDLEIELLFLLKFDLFVSREDYEHYYHSMGNMAVRNGITNDPAMLPMPLPPPLSSNEEEIDENDESEMLPRETTESNFMEASDQFVNLSMNQYNNDLQFS